MRPGFFCGSESFDVATVVTTLRNIPLQYIFACVLLSHKNNTGKSYTCLPAACVIYGGYVKCDGFSWRDFHGCASSPSIFPYNQAVALLGRVALAGTVFDTYEPTVNGTAI